MAQGVHRVDGSPKLQVPVVAANSTTFAEYSPVTINSSGFLAVISSSGEKVYGFCLQPFASIAANQTGTAGTYQTTDATVARFAPPVLAPDGVKFWADSDTALVDTDIGAYADVVSVSAGVVTLNLLAGTSGQFHVLGLLSSADPSAEGDTDRIIVEVAEPQRLGFTQD